MRWTSIAFVFGSFAVLIPAGASAQSAAPAQTRPLVASVESRWSDVYCDLLELARTNATELSVRYQYRNRRKDAFRFPHVNLVPMTRVFDPAAGTLFGVLKDAAGKPLSSTMMDGALARPVAAGRTQAHWARLEPPAEAAGSVIVLIEGCLPFEPVAIGRATAGGAQPVAAPTAALATQDGEADGLAVEVTRVARGPAPFLTVTVRYRNGGTAEIKFPNAAQPKDRFARAYLVDPATRKKFGVAQDKAGKPLSSDTLGYASSLGEKIQPGEAITVWAMFPAPPESTKTISLYVAQAPPFDGIAITGTGAGSGEAGSAIAGAVVGVDAALKELAATVTDSEIRIELAADVLFDFDKAEVKKDAERSLQNVAVVLKAHPRAQVAIEGHSDGRGADDYNQRLSETRAASVKQWLVTNAQVSAASVTTRGWGKSKPIAPNTKPDGSDDPAGRAKNRRVDIVVKTRG